MGNKNVEENLYQSIIVNDFEKINVNIITSQMEQWALLSNVGNYIHYNKNHINYYKLDVKALEPKIIRGYMIS